MSDDDVDFHNEVQIRTLAKFRVDIEKALHDGEYQFTSEEQGEWLFIVMQREVLDHLSNPKPNLEKVIRAIESVVPLAFRRYLGSIIIHRPTAPARIRTILYAILPYELHAIVKQPTIGIFRDIWLSDIRLS